MPSLGRSPAATSSAMDFRAANNEELVRLFTNDVEQVLSEVRMQDPAEPQSYAERLSYVRDRDVLRVAYIRNR